MAIPCHDKQLIVLLRVSDVRDLQLVRKNILNPFRFEAIYCDFSTLRKGSYVVIVHAHKLDEGL